MHQVKALRIRKNEISQRLPEVSVVKAVKAESRPAVLIIDDDPSVRGLIRDVLSEHYDIMEAENSAQIAEVLGKTKPDLITLDIGLPDVDGMEILSWINENAPDIPVVMITGDSSLEVAEEAMECNAAGFLMKPLNPQHLIVSVQDSLGTRRSRAGILTGGKRLAYRS